MCRSADLVDKAGVEEFGGVCDSLDQNLSQVVCQGFDGVGCK
jgi:hypothetical protein